MNIYHPEINTRANGDQLGLTQHALNKLRELPQTLVVLYREAVRRKAQGCFNPGSNLVIHTNISRSLI